MESSSDLGDGCADLDEREVLVVAEVEVLPLLLLLDLLSFNCLGNFLLLLNNVNDVAPPESVSGTMSPFCIQEDVVCGVDALKRLGDQLLG